MTGFPSCSTILLIEMAIQDRIVELRRVPASDLHPHPKNWRRHPKAQQDALRAMLDRDGFVGAVIARETPDGLMLIDGHLRADLTLVWKKPSFATSRGHYPLATRALLVRGSQGRHGSVGW